MALRFLMTLCSFIAHYSASAHANPHDVPHHIGQRVSSNHTILDSNQPWLTCTHEPKFFSNGSLCTNSSVLCPGGIIYGECQPLYYCFLPSHSTGTLKVIPTNTSANSTTPKPTPTTNKCSSPISILSTLGVLNILDAATSLLMGHQRIRQTLPRLKCFKNNNDNWTPWPGVVVTIFHLVPALISAAISRNHNPGMSYGTIFGLWTMRPRATFIIFGHHSLFRLAWLQCYSLRFSNYRIITRYRIPTFRTRVLVKG